MKEGPTVAPTEQAQTPVPHVYQAIATVMSRLSKDGIGKDRKNDQQGYKFRGIDDVYNALAPILADVGLCVLPRVKTREVTERQTQRGGTLFYVNVDVDFHFVSAKDGSWHLVSMCGEAMDSADKATNKAMSAAYKYACLQAFCIPTEGDNDADGTTHQVAPATAPAPVAVPKAAAPKKVQPSTDKTVGENEVASITKLCELAGVTLDKICAKYNIPFIEMLPLDKTAEVITRLQELATEKAAS
ncbi:Essential recombination function protein [uncultured Caudovirales phage]|uniref:Essential recombination function protein n=1 Tax=uncultured Caudovirales phage TaxID=2100421 RepID=A0A6J7WR70_9CAUD|nr:Essential recombination function protein [uncultured Caudovirales phage]